MVKIKETMVDIEDTLNAWEPKQKEIGQSLRLLVKNVVPETMETVKHGKITYKLGAVDFAWITRYKDHVDLEFAMGASLDSDMLKSRGEEKSKNVRYVTVDDFDKLKPEITRLLKSAALLDFKHCSSAPQK